MLAVMYDGVSGNSTYAGKRKLEEETISDETYVSRSPGVIGYGSNGQDLQAIVKRDPQTFVSRSPTGGAYPSQLQMYQIAGPQYVQYAHPQLPFPNAVLHEHGVGGVQVNGSNPIAVTTQVPVDINVKSRRRPKKQRVSKTKPKPKASTDLVKQRATKTADTKRLKTGDKQSIADGEEIDEDTRRERKNEREKQRRLEISTQFKNLEEILEIPPESGADKVTILAKAVETIKNLKSLLASTRSMGRQQPIFYHAPDMRPM